jgi:maltose O-acetyltransferase
MAIGGYWYYSHVQRGRYEASQFCSCGRDLKIDVDVLISSPEKMKIGDGVFIGSNCALDATGGLQIGHCCALASHVAVLTIDHHFRDAESIPWGDTRVLKPVVLEDYVWIGMHASILPGVTIGEGAIVGLGSVVAKDVPPLAIVVGNPGKIVGYRDKENFDLLKGKHAIKRASSPCAHLQIPEDMVRKYHRLLQDVGYDVDRRTGESRKSAMWRVR